MLSEKSVLYEQDNILHSGMLITNNLKYPMKGLNTNVIIKC